MKPKYATPEHRNRNHALADRQRLRALATARHAIQWLENEKGPSEKKPGDDAWSYDLNEALVLLRNAVRDIESALLNG